MAGSIDSNALSVALASLPDKPSVPPTSNASITRQDRLGIVITPLDSTTNGGSEIILYELQYDDGERGPFQSLFTLSPTTTFASNIKGGHEYRFKYRAQNFNGWGELSDISYYLAATVPGKPLAPIYVSSSASTIELRFVAPTDSGGSPLQEFELHYDTIQETANFVKIWNGSTYSVTLNTSTYPALAVGTTYRFILYAKN